MSIDVRCLPYMPLHIERLRRSKAWLRCKRRPELAFYLMNLWMRAWHEVPAGSIEADDDVLADAAMCSPEEWERIKADVLHGWEERDGRWHHHVVTGLAADGMEKVEALRRPIVHAMIQSRGMDEDARARFVMDRFADTITEGGWLLMHRDVIERLNAAMLGAQAVIQMQEAELRRLAAGGADVDEDILCEPETVQ